MIESQFEAFLMRLDGKDPVKVDRSRCLCPDLKMAKVIAPLFNTP